MLVKAKENQYHRSDEGKIARAVILSQHSAAGIQRPVSPPVFFSHNKWDISNNI